MVEQWNNVVEQCGTVKQNGGTVWHNVEQCGTIWWNSVTVWWNGMLEQCGTAWWNGVAQLNGMVEHWIGVMEQ